jgi:hypothetical protein
MSNSRTKSLVIFGAAEIASLAKYYFDFVLVDVKFIINNSSI